MLKHIIIILVIDINCHMTCDEGVYFRALVVNELHAGHPCLANHQ